MPSDPPRRVDPSTAPPPAPLFRRVLAGLIDLAVVAGIVAASAWNWGSKAEDGQWVLHGLPAVALMAFIPSYWLVVESMFGGTLGKLVLGLRVFSLDGSELELGQVLKRS